MPLNGEHQYPNAKARLRLARKAPGLPVRENYMDIWTKRSRFRVIDESGRPPSEILKDVSARDDLGTPHSIEEMMDIWSQSQRAGSPKLAPTTLYGDVATNEGWVHRGDQEPWTTAARDLAPAAEQILDRRFTSQLERRRDVTFLGRRGVEYQGVLKGDKEGVSYSRDIIRIVSAPFVLLNTVRDAKNPSHYYTTEVVSIEENVVTDDDVTPSFGVK